MKLFKTVNVEIVRQCRKCFGFELPTVSSLKKNAANLLATMMLSKIYCVRCVATLCNDLCCTFI